MSLAFTDPISGEALRLTSERTLAWPETGWLLGKTLFVDVTR